MMRTTLHHAANIEIVNIEKRRDRDAKQILRPDLSL
jgi:hypothetical protein